MNEADTCRKFIVPLLQAAGWDNEPHSIAEECPLTDGQLQLVAVRKHLSDLLKVPPISHDGNVNETIGKFSGRDKPRSTVNQLQSLLYAA